MKIIITESQLSFLVETENDKSISMIEEIKSSIDTLLSYYEKTDDGNFIDIQTKKPVGLKPIAGYLKSKIESVVFGVQQENKPDEIVSKVNDIKNQIISGKFKDFFGDYQTIEIPLQKFDFYSEKKCSDMNPKSPGCQA